jgi:hypothetical protein
MRKALLVILGIWSLSGMVFGQSRSIYGYPGVNLGMSINDFLRQNGNAVENNNTGINNVKVFSIDRNNNIERTEFHFYQERLFRVSLMIDTNEIPLSDFINNIRMIYGNFDDEKEEFENTMGMNLRIVTLQRNYNRNFNITILIQEIYSGGNFIQQLYNCLYYDPVVANIVRSQ